MSFFYYLPFILKPLLTLASEDRWLHQLPTLLTLHLQNSCIRRIYTNATVNLAQENNLRQATLSGSQDLSILDQSLHRTRSKRQLFNSTNLKIITTLQSDNCMTHKSCNLTTMQLNNLKTRQSNLTTIVYQIKYILCKQLQPHNAKYIGRPTKIVGMEGIVHKTKHTNLLVPMNRTTKSLFKYKALKGKHCFKST